MTAECRHCEQAITHRLVTRDFSWWQHDHSGFEHCGVPHLTLATPKESPDDRA